MGTGGGTAAEGIGLGDGTADEGIGVGGGTADDGMDDEPGYDDINEAGA